VRGLLLAAIALLLAGCAASDPGGDTPAPTVGARERRYQATATVLQSRDHGPELCLSGIARMSPPACRGLPIPNWRWDQVEGEQAAGGTTWGRYQLVGTYDGASFTVSRADLAPPGVPAERRGAIQGRSQAGVRGTGGRLGAARPGPAFGTLPGAG
jgi:hypothetical protein